MPVRQVKIWMVVAAIFGLLASSVQRVDAQTSNETGRQPNGQVPAVRQREVSQAVLRQLSDGHLDQALKELAVAADWELPLSLNDRDELSTACAGVHRVLAQLSAEEQFELLSKWSLPGGSSQRVRMLTAVVPTVAPPAEFARALGERPRPTSFAIASVGRVTGVFNSGWTLVVAARDAGRLKRLKADLKPLLDKQAPNADLLLTLVDLADVASAVTASAQLSERITRLQASTPASGPGTAMIDASHLVVAAAASQTPQLRSLSNNLIETLLTMTAGQPAAAVRPALQRAQVSVTLQNSNNSNLESVPYSSFQYWVPVSGNIGGTAAWQIDEDHAVHLAGSGTDTLIMQYPLVGDFEFRAEALSGGRLATDGGLVYGGVRFHADSRSASFITSDWSGTQIVRRGCPFAREGNRPTFNPLSIMSSNGTVTQSVNQHPMRVETSMTESSPWLGLCSQDEHRAMFRNLKLIGKPTIPRSVRLADGNQFRGWQSYAGKWKLADGVISAPQQDSSEKGQHDVEGQLAYLRPLLISESVNYEFVYQPGKQEVSPTLGRVAFQLHPDGVRSHWVTDTDSEWTGLNPDNSITEPLKRRGPRPLPLKLNDWNKVTLSRTESGITISVNETPVYLQPIKSSDDARFGFYHDRSSTSTQIRNVVLTGDWPQTLPQGVLDNPLATAGEEPTVAQMRSLKQFFSDDLLALNVFEVRRRALAMTTQKRIEFLSEWILPGPAHPGFRISGDFSPSGSDLLETQPANAPFQTGGQIVSPIFDWLDVAAKMNRLTDVRRRVATAATLDDEFQRRCQAALLTMLSFEQGDQTTITADCEKLHELVRTQSPTSIEEQWPETLVIARGVHKAVENRAFSELGAFIYGQRTQQYRTPGLDLWHVHMASLRGRMLLQKSDAAAAVVETSAKLRDWIPVAAATSAIRGQAFPDPHWQKYDRSVSKLAGQSEDFLFYRQPLSGDFEVECDLTQSGLHSNQVMFGGRYTGLHTDLKNLKSGTFRDGASNELLQPPMVPLVALGHYRGVIRAGVQTIYVNGRKVHTQTLSEPRDPWIAIRSAGRLQAGIENFCISGPAQVLGTVSLSGSKDLTGWINYHAETITGEQGAWEHVDDAGSSGWIVGHSNPTLKGMFAESLLRYQRPLLEDGAIEYDFFYQPGAFETHPALDRLVLLLDGTGIREHWVTDGRHDRTSLSPLNVAVNPKNRRGPDLLPLKSGDWNHLKLTLHGTTLGVDLNGQTIYERELEPENQRTFGLFHYADASEVMVRNVTMQGEWPKMLPSIAAQELASRSTEQLDEALPRLKAVFTHSFQHGGLPDNLFKVSPIASRAKMMPSAGGIQFSQSATGTAVLAKLVPRCSLSGDFDIEVGFSQLHLTSSKGDTGLLILTTLDAPRRPIYGVNRLLREDGMDIATSSVSMLQTDGNRSWQAELKPCCSDSGRLRLSRRGQKLFYLFAEGDSKTFRLLHSDAVDAGRVVRDGISLESICNGVGSCDTTWNSLELRAEQITWLTERENAAATFEHLDQNADGRLSLDEYARAGDAVKVLRRDFVIFDTNADGFLSLDEFTPIANGVDPSARGAMPDPFAKVLDEIEASVDRELNRWRDSPDEERDLSTFARVLLTKFANLIPPHLIVQADTDRNGKLSRAEAHLFFEIQMGIRLPGGQPLRTPNGQINNFSFFIHVDANRNNQIEKSEFMERGGRGNDSESLFTSGDKDRDAILSLPEWLEMPWTFFCPVYEFRRLDTNFDGYLDTAELVKGTQIWKMPGTPHLVKIYDVNQDGKLSLDEYRLSPHANMILVWQKMQRDVDNDAKLSLQEFTIDRPWFQIARWYYFQKFDQNQDGYLDLKEYDFNTQADPSKAKRPREIYTLNADGTGLKKLNIGKLLGTSIGSPAVSPDGKQLAFDAASGGFTVMLMPIEGGEPKPLGHGTQPTWSPDGKQFACRRFSPQAGSWIIDLVGGNEKFLVGGWGTQWSPDGKTIFSTTDYAATMLTAYDVKSGTSSVILNRSDTDFWSFDFNAGWSPDSRRICIMGTKPNEDQALVLIDLKATGPEKVKIRFEDKGIHSDIAWHPSGNKIVFAKICPERKKRQLYEINPDTTDAPNLLPGQPEDIDTLDMTWTPDGKRLIFIAGDY